MADERDEIRARIDIVDLIAREGVRLKKSGRSYTGLCPFHADKRPSFSVSPETGSYRCFSCGERGDIFTWVMKRQNVDFIEALKILAREAGVTLKRNPDEPRTDRELHQTAMDAALDFFREQLSRSTTALEYCARRGIDTETIQDWQLGYAPDVGEALATHLKKRDIPLAEAKSLFLVDQDASGGYFDKFRGRLIFPIRDEKGALVAFGGRLLGDGHPKYINSGDTPLYRKSRVLYGMYRARDTLNKDRRAILCEGYLDVIACHRAGLTGALASLGTSLADEQAKLLKRWADEVVILYDSDPAGQKAAARAVELLRPEGLRVRVALMPAGDDPDTLLRRDGADAVRRSVEGGLTPLDYRLQAIDRTHTPETPEYWEEVVAALASAETEMELARHVDRLAGVYPGTRNVIRAAEALRTQVTRYRRAQRQAKQPDAPQRTRHDTTPRAGNGLLGPERIFFRAFLHEQFRGTAYMVSRTSTLFESGLGQALSEAITRGFPEGAPAGPPAQWLTKIEPEDIRNAFSDLLTDPWEEPLTEQVLYDAIHALRNRLAQRQRLELHRSGADPNEILKRLREAKPDHRAKARPDDDFM